MPRSFPIFGSEKDSIHFDPEELIDLFLNSTADGIAILDLDSRYIRINHMYTKIFGHQEEEVIGKTVDQITDSAEISEILEQVKTGKTFTDVVIQRPHKDGTILDVAASYSPFRNTSGEVIALIAILRDITEFVDMERELKRTRELYKLITENTTDLIKVFTKDKTIVYASPSYEKVIGVPPEKYIGKNIDDFILPEEAEAFNGMFEKLLKTGEPQIFQKRLSAVEHEVMYAEYNVSPIFNDQQEIDSFVTVGRNITDRMKNDASLRNLDRLSIIGQLAAGVAHEIRNPLTSLKGFSKLLNNTSEKGKQSDYLSIIMNELDHIDKVVNEFMSLAKPQAIKFKQVQLISILDSTVNVLHPQAILHDVEIKINYPNEKIEILCSPTQLKQVFVNFLKNAIEAMPEGGTVHVHVQKQDNMKVAILFTDEGVGIDPEILNYLGTPFYTTKDKGIGLGLTVSNKILQEHNGTMQIKSQIGTGTTVKVELQCV